MRVGIFIFLAAAAFAQQQEDFSKVEIKVHKVAGNIYMLEGYGGNIGVSVGEDGILIVDDQYAPLAPKIKAALRSISDKPVKFVLNTHYHIDHTNGNEAFGESAPIIAHTNTRKRLASGAKVPSMGVEFPPSPKVALPVITFDDRVAVHINGEEIRAIHFPHGHTDGDVVVFFPRSNVLHMGDDFVVDGFPFIDLSNGGSVKGLIANVAKVLAQIPADAKIIPGHGRIATPNDLRDYVDMLKDATAIVEKGIKASKSLDQMKSEKVLAKYDHLGQGFIKTDVFLEILYTGLK